MHLDPTGTTWTEGNGGAMDWYRVERVDDIVQGFASSDGVNWSALGQPDGYADLDTVLVGLAVSGRSFAGAGRRRPRQIRLLPWQCRPTS